MWLKAFFSVFGILSTGNMVFAAKGPCAGTLVESDRVIYKIEESEIRSSFADLAEMLGHNGNVFESRSEEIFLWSDRADGFFNTSLQDMRLKSGNRLAHILSFLERERTVRILDLSFRNGPYATVPRLRFKNFLDFKPGNLTTVGVLGATAGFLIHESTRGAGLAILAFIGLPTIPQITYLMTHDRDPRVFTAKSIEKKIREHSHYMTKGSWVHIGLSHARINELPPIQIRITRAMRETRRLIDLDYWFQGAAEQTDLVHDLRNNIMLPLEREYGFGNSSFDLILIKTRAGRVRVIGIATHPLSK